MLAFPRGEINPGLNELWVTRYKNGSQGDEEIAQSVKFLQCKNEGLSSDPQYPCKVPEFCRRRVEKLRQEDPWNSFASQPN